MATDAVDLAAKNQLLKDTEKAGLSEILPRYPVHQGVNHVDQVINDVVNIIVRLDEQTKIDDLLRVGKTTLICKICEVLRSKGLLIKGFYTKECKESGTRVGFDVVTVDGSHISPLARIGEAGSRSRNCVGRYAVLVQSFEQVALPALSQQPIPASGKHPLFVVDEIGKMELLSTAFQETILRMLTNKRVSLLATIPVSGARSIPLVEELRCNPEAKIFEITKQNRNVILDELVSTIVCAYEGTSAGSNAT